MTLCLIRHAHASDGEPDSERPLSGKGRAQAERLGRFLRAAGGFEPEEIWHSPLLRARETAELIAEEAHWKAPLREVPGLEPEGRPELAAKKIAASGHSIAVVGHDPHLSLLSTLLVTGGTDRQAFVMRKATALALEPLYGPGAGCWAAAWQIAPELLR